VGEKGVPNPPTVWKDRLRDTGTKKLYQLGTERVTFDGDLYVYVKAGSTALAAGRFVTYLTTGTNEQTVTVAHGIGTTTVTVTAASISANDFEDGYLVVTAGTGIGECYRIRSNTATGDTGSGVIACVLYDGLASAWSTSTTDVTLYPNRFNGLIVNPNDVQQRPCCVTQWPIGAASYGWALKEGYGSLDCEVLAAGGTELDEKPITASVTDATNAGRGTITGSPTSTIYVSSASEETFDQAFVYTNPVYAMQPILGYVTLEADLTNDEAALVRITNL